MRRVLRTAFAGAATVGLTGGLSPVVAALSMMNEELPDPVLHFWADSILKASGVTTRVEGLEHLPAGNFVLAVNHLSNFDAVVLFRHVRRHMRFVAKAQLRKVPVFGYALEKAGNIFVDRTGSADDKEKLNQASLAVKERVSVVFFAEGTRSDDGQLKPFKKGAAMMALSAQVPLVPAAVAGTHLILPKGSPVIRPRPAALVIGAPIETAGKSLEAREELTTQAHASVEKLLARGNQLVTEMGG